AAPPGRRPQDGPWADLAVLAVPPAAVASSLAAAQARRLARWYTDVASVKALPLRQASELGCDLACFVPGHPLSGRERSGPAAAVARVLADVAADLAAVAEALAETGVPQHSADHPSVKLLAGLLEEGSAGVARIPGKRGTPVRDNAEVQVVIPDRPGELARLF